MEGTVKMQDIEVLWIDDDISTKGSQILEGLKDKISGIKLFTAKSCGESEKLLKSRPHPPQWAIVDLIVPQGGWDGDEYHPNPGIEYIKHLKKMYKDDINIYAFSILVTKDIADKIKHAGALDAFVKSNTSFAGILERIQNDQNGRDRKQTPPTSGELDERGHLKDGQS
jgi:hypothetical protein